MKISRRDLKLMLFCTEARADSLDRMIRKNQLPRGVNSKEFYENQLEELKGVIERVKKEMEQIDIELY